MIEQKGYANDALSSEDAQMPIPDLLYLRARYYNTRLGAFLSSDPVEGVLDLPMSLNGYSYAHGNPVNLTDPSGEFPFLAVGLAFALGGLIAGGIEYGSQVYRNMDQCGMSFWDAVYYKNLDRERLGYAVLFGAIEGAIMGGLGYGAGVAIEGLGFTGKAAWLMGGAVDIGAGMLWDIGVHGDTPTTALIGNLIGFGIGAGIGYSTRLWSEGFSTFYHGTDIDVARTLRRGGIDLKRGRLDADFGKGFYLAESHEAAEWSAERALKRRRRPKTDADVVEYRVPKRRLRKLGALEFTSPPDSSWSDFVRFHKEYEPQSLMHGGKPYDIVTGPYVRRIRRTGAVLYWENQGIQTSVHTQHGVDIFNRFVRR